MPTETLTPELILQAAEGVLRRYGPAKANVVDVARALGVSHGSVYRHFPSKAALRDAVAERWLHSISEPLALVAAQHAPAPERLHRWVLKAEAILPARIAAMIARFARTFAEGFAVVRSPGRLVAAMAW